MLIKHIATLIFAYVALAANSFIGDTKRAELFEITDNVVPTIRVTLPTEEYEQLIEDASKGYNLYNKEGEIIASLNHLNSIYSINDIDWSFMYQEIDYDPYQQLSFETKNATMTFEINGTVEKFKKITFKLGGSSSRMYGKSGYNIKIRGDKDLHGRTQLKIRPDSREATYLRTKLASDIHHRLGLPTISANYVNLYINDKYMGFYILEDAIKKSWIKYEYGEEKTTSLYECKSTGNDLTVAKSGRKCVNDNDDVTDNSELIELLTALDNANSVEDIEDIFDVDSFLYEIAYEYLVGSWDHLLHYGHNFYLYKTESGKWKYLITDYDGDFGQDISIGITGMVSDAYTPDNADFVHFSFNEWAHLPRHIIDILIKNDPTRFNNILKKFVTDAFNPAVLFPHIDELKEFIRPYVELDKTPDENGKYPGKNHEEADHYTFEEWEANCEFTTVKTNQNSRAYGLKYWILEKYRYVCKNYDMECDPQYMDEQYEYAIDESVECPLEEDAWLDWSKVQPEPTETTDVEPEPTETANVEPEPTETANVEPEPIETTDVEPEPIETTDVEPEPTETANVEPKPTETTTSNIETPTPSACNGPWKRCGGIGFTGSDCCEAGYTCEYQNDYYYQCVPSEGSSTITKTTTIKYVFLKSTITLNTTCSHFTSITII